MRSITFLGASEGIVTGSHYLLTDENGHGIVLDMGMFQGSEELEKLNSVPLAFDAREIHSMILTHAHLDHVGRLPMLTRHGFTGKIYATHATKALAEVVMSDSARINSREIEKPLLYTEEDVIDTLDRFVTVDYEQEFNIGSAKVQFVDAGHILGSASVILEDTGKRLIFSGDLGNSPQDIIGPTKYITAGDTVVMESTYGDKNHPNDTPDETIAQEIQAIERDGGTLLIPSFSIERTQVLLYKLDVMKQSGIIKKDTRVYLDSPMGIRATEIYFEYKHLFNDKLREYSRRDDPFDFPGLEVTLRGHQSQKINKTRGPKVIIAGSGMMNGGRILHHAKRYLSDPKTRLLIVGFQAENTIGREIVEGAKIITIDDREYKVNAKVTELYSMSAHADQDKLLKWFGQIKGAEKVFLTHGENPQRNALSEKLKENFEKVKQVHLPKLGETFEI